MKFKKLSIKGLSKIKKPRTHIVPKLRAPRILGRKPKIQKY